MQQQNNTGKRQGHYIHNVTYTYRERLAGAFVLLAILAVLVLMAINVTATHVFEKKIRFHAYLNSGEGITTDTAVKISGIEAGKVSSIEIAGDNRIFIEMYVYKRYHDRVRADATATLNRLSVLGATSIAIQPGSPEQPLLAEGATITLRETLSLEQLMEAMGGLLYRSDRQELASMVADIAEVAANLRAITTHIRSGEGAAGRLVYDDAFDRDIQTALASLRTLLDSAHARVEQAGPLLTEAGGLVRDLGTTAAELPALMGEIRTSTTEARRALAILNREMDALPDFMVRADVLLRDTAEVIDALENLWPISTALERPGEAVLVGPQVIHD